MADAMEADSRVILMGEDVNADGGVFKTNAGLPEKFPDRVLTTPICENGFTGVALGMSLTGMRPIVEFMFADFLPTAGDAIVNQLPKYRYMSGGQFSVPVTLRVICGGGGRFGTQHSATGESVVHGPARHAHRASAGLPRARRTSCSRAAIARDDPVIVHEHKVLYAPQGRGAARRRRRDRQGRRAPRRARTSRSSPRCSWSSARSRPPRRSAEEGIDAEVIDLRWVRPLDMATVGASVRKTGRLVIAEEQWHEGGWGATVISNLRWRATGMEGDAAGRGPVPRHAASRTARRSRTR